MPRDPVRLRECETGFFDELEGTHDDDGIEAEVPERESHSVASRQHEFTPHSESSVRVRAPFGWTSTPNSDLA